MSNLNVYERLQNASFLRDELNKTMRNAVLPVTVFIAVELIFGLFGNVLILIVYSGRYKRSNFRCFVLSMATVDLTSCCTTLPGEIISQLNWYNYQYGWICKVKSYFNIFTAWSSASILLMLAFDRYRKICRPFSWQIHTTLALKICGCLLTLSFLVSIPATILWGKQEYIYEYEGFNITVSVCEKSTQYADSIYPLVYIGSVYFLPTGSMIFVAGTLNFLTARKLFGLKAVKVTSVVISSTLHELSPERSDKSSTSQGYATDKTITETGNDNGNSASRGKAFPSENQRRQRALQASFCRKRKTIIMLVLTSVFIITMAVYVILTSFVAKRDGILKEMPNSSKVLFFFFWRLYFINCVINPILYGFMDPRFRSGLLRFLHKPDEELVSIKTDMTENRDQGRQQLYSMER